MFPLAPLRPNRTSTFWTDSAAWLPSSLYSSTCSSRTPRVSTQTKSSTTDTWPWTSSLLSPASSWATPTTTAGAGLRLRDFAARRLIRLHPMVVLGSVIGAAAFFLQGSDVFPAWSSATVWGVLGCMLLGCTLLPLPVQWDIRGWSEMHPLNGPAWSLYYEYIANIAYALVLRRLGRGALAVRAALAAAATMHLCLSSPQGDVVGGWSLTVGQQCWGLTRMAYPFLAGLLLARCSWRPRTGRHAFALCALALVLLLAVPQLGGEALWVNGLYEALCILLAFPLLVAAGSGGQLSGRWQTAVCRFLGNISYPLYLVHYPFVYIYTAWVYDNDASLAESLPYLVLTAAGCTVLAYLALRLYDMPVRSWLTERRRRRAACVTD